MCFHRQPTTARPGLLVCFESQASTRQESECRVAVLSERPKAPHTSDSPPFRVTVLAQWTRSRLCAAFVVFQILKSTALQRVFQLNDASARTANN